MLDMIERNDRVYFDGPAGTGKSYLLTQLARRWSGEHDTLVTCWNVLMADDLRTLVRSQPGVVVDDLNTLMLRLAGLADNPEAAGPAWYTEELPALALAAVQADQEHAAFDAICVDEFQDIAGFPAVLDLLMALAPRDAKFAFVGDARQQILRPADAHVDPFAIARTLVPDVVHIALRRGLRQVAGLTAGAEELLSRRFGYRGHRVTSDIDAPLVIRPASSHEEASHALAAALRELLEHHQAHDIVVLSPFGARNSLAGKVLAAENFSKEERWLRGQLRTEHAEPEQAETEQLRAGDGPVTQVIPTPSAVKPASGKGRVQWGSIFKYKGLDAEAVILTDIGDDAFAFVSGKGLDWFDLLYVGLTRARYRCIVIAN